MTWGQIRLQCQKWGENVDLDLLDQFLQGRYQEILDAHPWKALDKNGTIVTAAGSAGTRALYALPSDLKILLEVNNVAGNFPMRPYTQQELNLLFPGRPDTGAPYIYSMAEDAGAGTQAGYSTGTVATTNGAASVTGSGTTWTTAMTGMQIRIGSDLATYIFTYASSTTGTFDRPYDGATGSGTSYALTPAPPIHRVELYPIPSAIVTHTTRYTMIPPMFDPTAVTVSPLPWIPAKAIIDGVRADILALKKDYAGVQTFEALFAADINQMLRAELHRQPNSRASELTRYQAPATFPVPPGNRG